MPKCYIDLPMQHERCGGYVLTIADLELSGRYTVEGNLQLLVISVADRRGLLFSER